jgi:lipopolysaccharide export LptBFGC system permease protein LptF
VVKVVGTERSAGGDCTPGLGRGLSHLQGRFLRELLGSVGAALAGLLVFGWVALLAAAVSRAPVQLDLLALTQITGLLAPSVFVAVAPAAMLAGALGLGRRWAEEGALIGLQSGGARPGSLAGPALGLGLGLGLLCLALAQAVEPAARAALRRSLVEAATRPALHPGAAVGQGDFLVVAREEAGGDVLIGAGRVVVAARRAVASPDGRLLLEAGELVDLDHPQRRLRFEAASFPLPALALREEAVERSGAALAGLIDRMREKGRAADFERMVLWRRSAVAALPAGLGLIGLWLGLKARWPVAGGLLALFGLWAFTRAVDQAVGLLGGPIAAWAPGLGVLGLGLWMGRRL